MTEVTDADREAVNAFHSVSFRLLMDSPKNNLNATHQALLEAFARHRAKAEARVQSGIVAWLEPIRSDLSNISNSTEDEGDRIYFGSTNDADLLQEVWQKVESWLHKHEWKTP